METPIKKITHPEGAELSSRVQSPLILLPNGTIPFLQKGEASPCSLKGALSPMVLTGTPQPSAPYNLQLPRGREMEAAVKVSGQAGCCRRAGCQRASLRWDGGEITLASQSEQNKTCFSSEKNVWALFCNNLQHVP